MVGKNRFLSCAKAGLGLAVVSFTFQAAAKPRTIQILHTNDLHSALVTAGAPAPDETEMGGWPQLKKLIDTYRDYATQIGIPTLVLDAGDFYEGSVYSFADEGDAALQAYQAFQFDAAALGNHDWLTGADPFDRVLSKNPFSFPMLSANFLVHKSLPNLNRNIEPTSEHILGDGTRVGIVGLSTTEAFYKWCTDIDSRKKDARFGNVNIRARMYLDDLRRRNDLVLALTHLGTKTDRKLVKNTRGLDLVVGGHSHTLLKEPIWETDRAGNRVPIVQSGNNGRYLGRILVEFDPENPLFEKKFQYEVLPVNRNAPADPIMETKIQVAEAKLVERYGQDYLYRPIGTSPVRLLSGDRGPTAFSRFVTESMIHMIEGAEIAFDFGAFHGATDQAAGPIGMKMLMDLYPRRFELDRKYGTNIWVGYVPGWAMKLAISLGADYGLYMSTAGLSYKIEGVEKIKSFTEKTTAGQYARYFAKDLKIKDQPIKPFKKYKTVLPEAFVRGAFAITPLASIFIRKHQDTGYPIWEVMERYLKKIKTIEPVTMQNSRFIVNELQIREKGAWADVPWHSDEDRFSEFMKDLLSINQNDVIPARFQAAIQEACEEDGYRDPDCVQPDPTN